MPVPTRANGYNAKKTAVSGQTFASHKEAKRYGQLVLMQRAGYIQDLKTQVRFELIPAAPKESLRATAYIADFTYWQNGEYIVEDSKGVQTPEFVIKRKLMWQVHKILVKLT